MFATVWPFFSFLFVRSIFRCVAGSTSVLCVQFRSAHTFISSKCLRKKPSTPLPRAHTHSSSSHQRKSVHFEFDRKIVCDSLETISHTSKRTNEQKRKKVNTPTERCVRGCLLPIPCKTSNGARARVFVFAWSVSIVFARATSVCMPLSHRASERTQAQQAPKQTETERSAQWRTAD